LTAAAVSASISAVTVQRRRRHEVKKRSWFLTSEDWWSVYLGLFLVVIAAIGLLAGVSFDFIKGSIPATWPATPLFAGLAASWTSYLAVYLVLAVITGIGVKLMGGRLGHYLASFTILFVGGFLILVLGSQQTLKTYGLEYPFWALVIGLVIGNLFKLPEWFKAGAARTEFFIKTGIVLLGASLPFTIIVQGGVWGFLEAVIIVAAGFTVAFLISKAFGFDGRFAAVLGAGSSVCGVSAAIAVGASVKADEKKVGYVVSLVVLYALALIFLLPLLGRLLQLTQVVVGAWIGGSELADAAGLAAATIVGEKAVSAFSLVKLNRDVMIGVLAFIFASVAVARWERSASAGAAGAATGGRRADARIIWERFPKFVLAFLVASLLVTDLVTRLGKPNIDAHLIGVLNALRTWLFTLAFLCIGLNTRFADVRALGPKPVVAFTVVVLVNLVLGFVLANLFFGGILAAPLG
jgi:uncharacterized integral membrane protein (TIGR00698 family)